MGKAMTFVVIAWLSVVLVFSAWMIAQSGRYIRDVSGADWELLDTHTGTTYYYRKSQGSYIVRICGPSAYFCERER